MILGAIAEHDTMGWDADGLLIATRVTTVLLDEQVLLP